MAERNPSSEPMRAVANIYVVTVPLPSDVPDTSSEAGPPATWASDHLPTFDDEAPLGLRQANRSTDDCGEEVTKCDCSGAVISDIYAEIAEEEEEEMMEEVEHIYESLEDCVA